MGLGRHKRLHACRFASLNFPEEVGLETNEARSASLTMRRRFKRGKVGYPNKSNSLPRDPREARERAKDLAGGRVNSFNNNVSNIRTTLKYLSQKLCEEVMRSRAAEANGGVDAKPPRADHALADTRLSLGRPAHAAGGDRIGLPERPNSVTNTTTPASPILRARPCHIEAPPGRRCTTWRDCWGPTQPTSGRSAWWHSSRQRVTG